MIYKPKIGDIVSFFGNVYYYEVIDVYRKWVWLRNCLLDTVEELHLQDIENMRIKIIRRMD